MIKTDDVVILELHDRRFVTLVTQGQDAEWDTSVRVYDPEEPGARRVVSVEDVELLTDELAEEILGAV